AVSHDAQLQLHGDDRGALDRRHGSGHRVRVPIVQTAPMPTIELVLASGSTYRARMLTEAGYRVTIDPPEVDERSFDRLFEELESEQFALELARRKLDAVAGRHPDAVVAAADQVGVLDVD